jgi:hypothetical protein
MPRDRSYRAVGPVGAREVCGVILASSNRRLSRSIEHIEAYVRETGMIFPFSDDRSHLKSASMNQGCRSVHHRDGNGKKIAIPITKDGTFVTREHSCPRDRVQRPGLWNQNHVDEAYDPTFTNTDRIIQTLRRWTSSSSRLRRSRACWRGCRVVGRSSSGPRASGLVRQGAGALSGR